MSKEERIKELKDELADLETDDYKAGEKLWNAYGYRFWIGVIAGATVGRKLFDDLLNWLMN